MNDNVIPFPNRFKGDESNLKRSLERIHKNQLEFQALAGIPILDVRLDVKFELTEGMLLKLIEEIVEFRKTMPSSFNKFEKNRALLDMERLKGEFCDMILFMINVGIIWGFSVEELVSQISYVQANNFAKIREKIRRRAIDEEARLKRGGELFEQTEEDPS